jgi:hypothetical protein
VEPKWAVRPGRLPGSATGSHCLIIRPRIVVLPNQYNHVTEVVELGIGGELQLFSSLVARNGKPDLVTRLVFRMFISNLKGNNRENFVWGYFNG